MLKRLTILLLLASCSQYLFSQSAGTRTLYTTIKYKDSYETKADSMTRAFIYTFWNNSKRAFNIKYQSYADNAYWQQAPAINVVIYNYERHKDIDPDLAKTYLNYIRLWYKNKGNNYSGAAKRTSSNYFDISYDYTMFQNRYTDDMCWVTLALLHYGEAIENDSCSTIAKLVFDNYIISRANEDEKTGGLWLPWNTDEGSEPNACTQSPATLIAALLYQKFGEAKYLEYAKKLYKYAATNIVKSEGRVGEPPLTYTQGTFAEACRILYHISDESTNTKNKYKNFAYTYLNCAFTSNRCINAAGYLRDEGHDGNQSIFKAVLIPYAVNYVLDETMPQTTSQPYRKDILELILKNTSIMWKNLNISRFPRVFCNYDWSSAYTGTNADAAMGAMCSGSSLMENTARMCVAIIDRYELGTLKTKCSRFVVEPGLEEEAEMIAFNAALATATEIMNNPGDYTHAQFRQAIENLETTYQAAANFTTGIVNIEYSTSDIEHYYSLDGRRINGKPAIRGIYIKGGRKIFLP